MNDAGSMLFDIQGVDKGERELVKTGRSQIVRRKDGRRDAWVRLQTDFRPIVRFYPFLFVLLGLRFPVHCPPGEVAVADQDPRPSKG